MPLLPIPAQVHILINGAWTDVTSYVRHSEPITITGGRTDRGDTMTPAQCTMTLDNRDGRFSPNFASGAYYPYLQRNVQLRVYVDGATSSSGNTYTGYRFWGEVANWPPMSDISGEDISVQITANGPLRRFRKGGGKGSALTRYYASLTGLQAPIAYWPCEEDSSANTPSVATLAGANDGGQNMTVTVGTPRWKHVTDFNGSAPIGILNKSTWVGQTSSLGGSGDDVYTIPGTYTFIATTSSIEARCWGAGGGGANGSSGPAGGGGEFRKNTALAVTAGNSYTVIVGAGGDNGAGTAAGGGARNGKTGGDSSIVGDAATVLAHGGGGTSGSTGGSGGSGGTGPTGFAGGNGGSNPSNFKGGAGGGGSAGTAAAGNNGSNPSGCSGANGGSAVTGGGKGGNGGDGCANPSQGSNGAAPGGGGGGGGDSHTGWNWAGGSGGAGKVELIYTPASAPPFNIVRFIMFVPKHGGNDGKVLVRANTGGTIARLDVVYVRPGLLQLKGYNNVNTLLFTSSTISAPDGQTLMVSAEMNPSGANVAWKLATIIPGNSALTGSTSGTQNTASLGNVSTITVGPNADVTKTAIGHVSLQYARVSLPKVSKALHGHHTEMGIDRFIRLATEQALGGQPEFNETADHWGFETGTQSWVGTNCSLTSSTSTFTPVDTDTTPNLTMYSSWPPDGTHSLQMTANGAGQPTATSPTGTNGQPVNVGDIVSVNAEVYRPGLSNNTFIGILWYQANGTACAHAEDDNNDTTVAAGETKLMRCTFTAPATAAFFAVKFGAHATDANGVNQYWDNVRTHPRMGPQTRKAYQDFLEEVEKLDQGIMKEARDLWGLKYRTRLKLINQPISVTLDYSKALISPPFAPVLDDKMTKNDITVHRHKGSKLRVTLGSGSMSVLEPPGGAGRYKHHIRIAAEADEQLAALAAHLLSLGTSSFERFPTITINLLRAGVTSNNVAPLMSAIAGVEIGDFVKVTNLPFWMPAATTTQLVIGYAETISEYEWTVTWNCVPEAPYEITASATRRW